MSRFHLALTLLAAGAIAGCTAPEPRPQPPVVAPSTAMVAPAPAPEPPPPGNRNAALLEQLSRLAPDADRGVLALALEARTCALAADDVADASRLAVIDYTRPSTQPRLWVFDLDRGMLLYDEHVAHGRGSGENFATAFSNRDGSHQSSLGLFTTADTYVGGNGYSLRMDGLDPGFNDNARQRLIVMHGAAYVDPVQARRQGRLGRSWGCPALRPQVAHAVIDTLKGGQLLFAYADEADWLSGSRWFGCSGRNAREILASARRGGGGMQVAAR
jgi:hypothetical protein